MDELKSLRMSFCNANNYPIPVQNRLMAVSSGRQAVACIRYSGGLFAGIVAGCRAERNFLGKAPGVKSGMPFHSAGSSGM